MKVMTCRQMGGPCDAPIQGETADEMMTNGAAHVTEMAEKDEEHKEALSQMQAMQENPESEESKAWGEDFAQKFAALSEG